ncbi:MAG TPA: rhodanese-like domain-containing protein [Anaerolineae bacterium]|nr:rhodanese-like domain-containing protein [Anaerolineae bacterium]
MLVKPFVDQDLGNSSYLVASEVTGRALVIDPQRDVDRYLQAAEGLGLRLVYALDTHLHADFLSGGRELLAALPRLAFGASAEAGLEFGHMPLGEGSKLRLGDLTIGVLSTPGHSPDHLTYTLTPEGATAPAAIFSGGALIVGGAARTDLLGHERTEPLARQLYHTFQKKLLPLPDGVVVYPTHGAGSFCAVPQEPERTTTIGRERRENPLARAGSEEEFVRLVLSDLGSYPTYYRFMRRLNQLGPPLLSELPARAPLSPEEVGQAMKEGVWVVDTRPPLEFAAGHIPGSTGIPLDAPLATWAGWVIPFLDPIVLVAAGEKEREAAMRQLFRIGYDDVRGFLAGGIGAWEAAGLPLAEVPVLSPRDVHRRLAAGEELTVLDVRQESEWLEGHIRGATHIEAGRLPAATSLPFDPDQPIVVQCAVGDRSTVAISLLEQRGYHNVSLLEGGLNRWEARGLPLVSGPESQDRA